MNWQPIETAPDGVEVLVCGRYTDVSVGRRDARGAWIGVADGRMAIETQGDFGTTYIELDPVEYWMPVPTPPTDQRP